MQHKSASLLSLLTLYFTLSLALFGCAKGKLPESAKQGQYSQSHTYRLDNGMEVLLWPNRNSHSKNEASLNLIIHAGSLQETDQQLGHAHFLEHMAFNQTDAEGNNLIKEGLEALDLNLLNHANAYTTYDHTRYYLNVNDTSTQKLRVALSLLAKLVRNAPNNELEVAKEVGVVREEWRRSEPQKKNYLQQQQELMFGNSRYALRPPIGNLDSINNVTLTELIKYHQQHYHPGNASLVVTGDFDLSSVAAAVKEVFSDWHSSDLHISDWHSSDWHSSDKNSSIRGRSQTYPKPDIRYNTFDVIEDLNTRNYYVWLGNTYPYQSIGTPEGTYWEMVTYLIMEMLNDRMIKLDTKDNQTYELWGSMGGSMDHFANIGIGFGSTEEHLEKGIKLLAQVLQNTISQGFTQAEWDNARNQFLLAEANQQDGARHLADVATHHFTQGAWIRDQKHYLGLFQKRLPKLTLAALNTYAKGLFRPPYSIKIVTQPGLPHPTEEQVRGWIKVAQKQTKETLPTPLAKAKTPWKIHLPAGEIVEQHTLDNGIHQLLLSNGIKVNYLYSDSTPGKVYMDLFAPGGLNNLSPQEVVNARLGLTVIESSGLQDLDGHALRNWLEGQNMTLRPKFYLNSRGFLANGPSDKTQALLKTLHVALHEARVDPAMYDYYRPQFKKDTHDAQALSYWEFTQAMEQLLSQGHPAHRSLTIEEINSVSSESMQAIYQQYIAGTQDYILNIVGDIPLTKLIPDLRTYIASLPQTGQPLTPALSIKFPKDADIVESGGESEAAGVFYYLQIARDSIPKHDNLHLYLLAQYLQKPLNQVLREDQGLTYSVSVNAFKNHPEDTVATLQIYLQCDPDKVEQVLAHISLELQKLNHQGISQEAINQRIDNLRYEFNNAKHQAKFILSHLTEASLQDQDMNHALKAQAVYPQTSANAIAQLLATFIDNNHSKTTAILYPE